MHGRGRAWQGEEAYVAGGTHPTEIQSCAHCFHDVDFKTICETTSRPGLYWMRRPRNMKSTKSSDDKDFILYKLEGSGVHIA